MYEDLAIAVIRMAREQGATDAECTIAEGDEFSVSVRLGEVENLKEAGSRGAGLRVLVGQRAGSSYTSDLTSDGLRRMVEQALEIAGITSEDPFAGLPEEREMGRVAEDLQLFSDDVARLDTAAKIDLAKRAEAAAIKSDARITNSEGGSFDTYQGSTTFANSRGFVGSYRSSSCSITAVPVAQSDGSMERDYYYTAARGLQKLKEPEEVGRLAAERVLRRLNARKIGTQKVPVLFEPRTARALLGNLLEAVSGTAVYRHESFLADQLGQTVASPLITLIDDGTLPGLFGTSPFDAEGVPPRRTVVIENGVLRSFLLNTYTGRKLGMRTTGNASRGLTGNAGIGAGNFYLAPGEASPQDLLARMGTGLLLTELLGFGVNVVTGDFSQGAAGLWVEGGKIAYPVAEITVASTLQQMLTGIVAVGNDLEFTGSIAAPSLLIGEMTISGS